MKKRNSNFLGDEESERTNERRTRRKTTNTEKTTTTSKQNNTHNYNKYIRNLNKLTKKNKKVFNRSLNGTIFDIDEIGSETRVNELSKRLPIETGDRRMYWIRELTNKVLPTLSQDQRAYMMGFDILFARLIYGDELDSNLPEIVERNGWTRMNSKGIFEGPRRTGKSTILALYILLVGIVINDARCLVFSKTKKMSTNLGDIVRKQFKALSELIPGIEIVTNNTDEFSFSRFPGHLATYIFLPGTEEISIFKKPYILLLLYKQVFNTLSLPTTYIYLYLTISHYSYLYTLLLCIHIYTHSQLSLSLSL